MKPLPLLGLLLAAGLILSIAVLSVAAAVESHPAAPGIEAGILRGRQADAARWNLMAANFAAKQASNLERARIADAARYTGVAAIYAAKQAANLERARLAEAARWNLMAAHSEIGQVISLERARMADAARWNLMAANFAAKQAAPTSSAPGSPIQPAGTAWPSTSQPIDNWILSSYATRKTAAPAAVFFLPHEGISSLAFSCRPRACPAPIRCVRLPAPHRRKLERSIRSAPWRRRQSREPRRHGGREGNPNVVFDDNIPYNDDTHLIS